MKQRKNQIRQLNKIQKKGAKYEKDMLAYTFLILTEWFF